MAPGLDTSSQRNEYREYLLGGNNAYDTLPHSTTECLEILGSSDSWIPKCLSRPVQGWLYLTHELCAEIVDYFNQSVSVLQKNEIRNSRNKVVLTEFLDTVNRPGSKTLNVSEVESASVFTGKEKRQNLIWRVV